MTATATPSKRRFLQRHPNVMNRLARLLRGLSNAIYEQVSGDNSKQSLLKAACIGTDRPEPSDFDEIRHLTIGEVIDLFQSQRLPYDGSGSRSMDDYDDRLAKRQTLIREKMSSVKLPARRRMFMIREGNRVQSMERWDFVDQVSVRCRAQILKKDVEEWADTAPSGTVARLDINRDISVMIVDLIDPYYANSADLVITDHMRRKH